MSLWEARELEQTMYMDENLVCAHAMCVGLAYPGASRGLSTSQHLHTLLLYTLQCAVTAIMNSSLPPTRASKLPFLQDH